MPTTQDEPGRPLAGPGTDAPGIAGRHWTTWAVLGGIPLVLVAYAVRGPTSARDVTNLFVLLLGLLALGAALASAVRLRGKDRAALVLMLAAAGLAVLGSVVAFQLTPSVGGDGLPVLDVINLSVYAVMVGAILLLLPWSRERGATVEHVLDVVVYLSSSLLVAWVLLFSGLASAYRGPSWQVAVDLAYPCLAVLMVAAATVVMLQANKGRARAMALIAFGLALLTLQNVSETSFHLRGTEGFLPRLEPLVPIAALLAGAGIYRLGLAPAPDPGFGAPRWSSAVWAILPAVVVVPVGVYHFVSTGGLDVVTFSCAVVLFSAVVLRQFLFGLRIIVLSRRLHRMNSELEERVRERTSDVLQVTSRLEELAALKTSFLNSVSHELRTPLTPLLLHADLLGEEALGPLSERQRPVVASMQRNLARLDDVLREVTKVALAQGEGITVRRQGETLAPIVARAVARIAPEADQRGVLIDVEGDASVTAAADAAQLQRALEGVILHAVHISGWGDRVGVETQAVDGGARIIVDAPGFELDPKAADELFEPFAPWAHGGRGGVPTPSMGLFIARLIVERHDGHILARSRGPGMGAEIVIALPGPRPVPGPHAESRGASTQTA